jgi:hypothetical protein
MNAWIITTQRIVDAHQDRSEKQMLDWFRQTMAAEPDNLPLQLTWLIYLEYAHEDNLLEKEEIRLMSTWAEIVKHPAQHSPFVLAMAYYCIGNRKYYATDCQKYAQKALAVLEKLEATEEVSEFKADCEDMAQSGNRTIIFYLDDAGMIIRPESPSYKP